MADQQNEGRVEKCSWCDAEFKPWRYSHGICKDCIELTKDKVAYLQQFEQSQEYILRRYPLLIAHLICESLGYFTPRSAANALIAHKEGRAFACEWYSACCPRDKWFDKESLKAVNRSAIRGAFVNRFRHEGYMRNGSRAKFLVKAELEGRELAVLASWF